MGHPTKAKELISKEPIKIVIHLDGGLIWYVYGDHPLDVIILDTDVDHEEEEQRITIKDVDGKDLEIYDYTNKIEEYRDPEDREATEHYFSEIRKTL